jgi:hypothetical protein
MTTAIQFYEDTELIKLRREVKTLIQTLVGLQGIKAEIEEEINALSRRYQQELGHLLAELLELRRDHLEQAAEAAPEPEAAYQQAQADGESNGWKIKNARPETLLKLSPEEKRELKALFRKASKLCHPDVVSGRNQEKARATFIELKLAYERNNLERVREIFYLLRQNKLLAGTSAESNDKEMLQAEIKYLRARAKVVYQEIQELKQSQSYKRLLKIDDWNLYFTKVKARLQRQIERLRQKKQPGPSELDPVP